MNTSLVDLWHVILMFHLQQKLPKIVQPLMWDMLSLESYSSFSPAGAPTSSGVAISQNKGGNS